MHSSLFIGVCLAVTSFAAPAILNDVYKPSDELADFYGKVSKHIDNARQILDPSSTCDTSKIALPSSSDLPSPDDQKPIYVALGRGTQVREKPTRKRSYDIRKLTTRAELQLRNIHIRLKTRSHRRCCEPLQCHLHRSKLPGHAGHAPENRIQDHQHQRSILFPPTSKHRPIGPSFLPGLDSGFQSGYHGGAAVRDCVYKGAEEG